MDLMVKKMKEIEMPDEMQERIIKNCYKKMNSEAQVNRKIETNHEAQANWKIERNDKNKTNRESGANSKTDIKREIEGTMMNRRREKSFLKRTLNIAAALVLCVCLTGFTALATTGKLQGFFKDITNWQGAVTGTEYEQATEEISINLIKLGEELNVFVTFANPEAVPYREFEEFGIENFRIEDADGNVIVDDSSTDMVKINNGEIELRIPLESIPSGNYKLVIESFVGGKKADQPLRLNGLWECEFVY